MAQDLPNKARNDETIVEIKKANGSDLGVQTARHTSIATATAALNVAESLQLLQLQLIETGKENRKTLDELKGQISGLTYVLSTTIEQQVSKTIASNKTLAESNDYYAKWNKNLTIALIVTTLIVGLLQAFVIWHTSTDNHLLTQVVGATKSNQ